MPGAHQFFACRDSGKELMINGWIKIHRQIRENEIYKHSTAMHLWLECLLRASHEQRTVLLKRERITLEVGSFVYGYREMASIVSCSVSTAKFWMDYFEAERMIERTTTPKGTVCKLKNWIDYQSTERDTEHQTNAERTLSEPNKKEKNVKNTYAVRPETEQLLKRIDELCTQYGLQNSVNSKSLDIIVERYLGKVRMNVELQHCISWLVEKNLRAITTQRIGNWFRKAQEIQKRNENKQLEWKEAKVNPAQAAKLRTQSVPKPEAKEEILISPEARQQLLSQTTHGL